MIELSEAMKATLTTIDGVKVDYSPAAVMMMDDEQYLIMRADKWPPLMEDEVLLLHIEHDGEHTRLTVVDDQGPFRHAIEDSLGLSNQIH